MADTDDFKIKGAATVEHAESVSSLRVKGHHQSNHGRSSSESVSPSVKAAVNETDEEPVSTGKSPLSEPGEVEASSEDVSTDITSKQNEEQERQDQLQRYRWCKCVCDPSQFGRDHYFLHMDTQQSVWEEPSEPYWLWDASTQAIDDSGLHYPSSASKLGTSEIDSTYTGYNPKIHGHYDPNADYAQYHNQKREEEALYEQGGPVVAIPGLGADYGTAAGFNRFTGSFQTADKSTERHSDQAKSGRQMGAYFDVDAAANAHDGRSLKEERRNEKLSKKQIKEMADKRRAKKEKKRMDFYKS